MGAASYQEGPRAGRPGTPDFTRRLTPQPDDHTPVSDSGFS